MHYLILNIRKKYLLIFSLNIEYPLFRIPYHLCLIVESIRASSYLMISKVRGNYNKFLKRYNVSHLKQYYKSTVQQLLYSIKTLRKLVLFRMSKLKKGFNINKKGPIRNCE